MTRRFMVLALLLFSWALAEAQVRPMSHTVLGVGMLGLHSSGTAAGQPVASPPSRAEQVSDWIHQQVLERTRGASPSHPRYFFIPFGYQSPLNDAHRSHTFASFVRATGHTASALSWFTISWLPATFGADLKITVFGAPVPGHDYSLEETLAFADRESVRLACWGPYEITPLLYRAARQRLADLRTGKFAYVPDDHGYRERGEAFNCMHAVADLSGELETYGGLFNIGIGYWGIKGTQHVLEHYRSHGAAWLVDPIDPARFELRLPDSVQGTGSVSM